MALRSPRNATVCRRLVAGVLLLLASMPVAWASGIARHDCAALPRMALSQAHIVATQRVAAGTFVSPRAKPGSEVPAEFRAAPAFCRVRLVLKPTPDSDIKVEVWLPARGWNGRFRGQGNGGFAGYINYAGLATAVGQGYASASTDTGHSGGDAAWALGPPEKVIDFGYRAIHLMTVDAKAIVTAYYGRPAREAYFASCSNGGRQALMEAQRFPDDYNGILAGAPAYDWTRLLTNGLGIMQYADSVKGYIPPSKLPVITHAVLQACPAHDGVLDDPRQCRFNPAVLLCRKGESSACLTAAQVAALKVIYDGTRTGAGQPLYFGTLPGAEDAPGGWNAWIFGPKPGDNAIAFFVDNYFADMVYDDPHWNYRSANLADALALADRNTAAALNATDANLQPFVAHGGKLILYHGWNDPAISPLATIAYYQQVVHALGRLRAGRSVRLYMVPGMLHCDGGPGAHAFGQNATDPRSDPGHDVFATLVRWVEQGQPPAAIIATKYVGAGRDRRVAFTRPLCPYPREARYRGKGDRRSAAAFACSGVAQGRAGRRTGSVEGSR